MKITDLKVSIICIPYQEPEPWAWGIGHQGVNSIIIELFTDEGIVGIGEGTSPHSSVEYSRALLDTGKKLLLGEDPLDIERVMRKLWAAGLTDHRVISGLEMALWDILGKACNKPLYRLLGGAIDRQIRFAPWLNRKETDKMASQALNLIQQGFTEFYIKVGINPNDDIKAVKSVRETIGDKYSIRVDANLAWTPSVAIKMIKKLERYDIEFVEDPTYIDGMHRVKKAVDTPLCSGAETLHEISRVVKENLADLIGHIDPRMQGGILYSKKACAVCEAAGLPVLTHAGWELSIATYAILHIIASTPNFIFSNQTYYMYLKDDIRKGGKLDFHNGTMTVPEGSGLGIELDRKKIQKYADLYKSQGGYSIYETPKREMMKKILPYPIY